MDVYILHTHAEQKLGGVIETFLKCGWQDMTGSCMFIWQHAVNATRDDNKRGLTRKMHRRT